MKLIFGIFLVVLDHANVITGINVIVEAEHVHMHV